MLVMAAIDVTKLVTVPAAAKLLGLKRQSVYSAIYQHRLTAVTIDGRLFVSLDEVSKYKPDPRKVGYHGTRKREKPNGRPNRKTR